MAARSASRSTAKLSRSAVSVRPAKEPFARIRSGWQKWYLKKIRYNMNDRPSGEVRMAEAEAAAVYVRPVGEVGVAASPLGWGVARRVAWAAVAGAALGLAVLWALSRPSRS